MDRMVRAAPARAAARATATCSVRANRAVGGAAGWPKTGARGARRAHGGVRRRVTSMKADPVATQYATAFINLTTEKNVLDDARSDLDSIQSLLKSDKSLASFLMNPVASAEKKKSIIKSLASEAEFNQFSANFLCLLVDKQRIDLVEDVCEAFEDIYCEVTDTEVATVTSAETLDNDQQFEIAKKLQKITGAKNIKLRPKVDESLISGIIVQYGKGGSKLMDMSVKGQLDKIEDQLLANAPSA